MLWVAFVGGLAQALYGHIGSYRDVLYNARDLPAHPEEAGENEEAMRDPAAARDDIMDAYLLHILQVWNAERMQRGCACSSQNSDPHERWPTEQRRRPSNAADQCLSHTHSPPSTMALYRRIDASNPSAWFQQAPKRPRAYLARR